MLASFGVRVRTCERWLRLLLRQRRRAGRSLRECWRMRGATALSATAVGNLTRRQGGGSDEGVKAEARAVLSQYGRLPAPRFGEVWVRGKDARMESPIRRANGSGTNNRLVHATRRRGARSHHYAAGWGISRSAGLGPRYQFSTDGWCVGPAPNGRVGADAAGTGIQNISGDPFNNSDQWIFVGTRSSRGLDATRQRGRAHSGAAAPDQRSLR